MARSLSGPGARMFCEGSWVRVPAGPCAFSHVSFGVSVLGL